MSDKKKIPLSRKVVVVNSSGDTIKILNNAQKRIIKVLGEATGPITRSTIAERSELSEVYVGLIIGYGPTPRCSSLIGMGYVKIERINIDGKYENLVKLLDKGRKEFDYLKEV